MIVISFFKLLFMFAIFIVVQAVEAYEAAVKADAGHHAAALALAKLHLDRGEEEAGRVVCTHLLAAQPDNVQARLLMVQLLSTQVSPQQSCLIHSLHQQAAAFLQPY